MPATSQVNHPQPDKVDYILLDADHGIKNDLQLQFLLESIFADAEYAAKVKAIIYQHDPQLRNISSINAVLATIKKGLHSAINPTQFIPRDDAAHLLQVANFEHTAIETQLTYDSSSRPRSDVFWPNPVHAKYPATRMGMWPAVEKFPLIDKKTPIGSAGSCFAIEIARVLQEREFNYVITERADDPASGVFVDGYKAGDRFAPGSFSSGIQFNTGNFRHLAEKAFEVREFKKILVNFPTDSGRNRYVDPYREDVFFVSPNAYLADYENHRAAVRKALTSCEVFVLTPGLNECWEFADGTVMARNPKIASFPYSKHKVLTVDENVNNLQAFFDLVKQHNPNFKLIVSLSPVPFLATGRAQTHHVIAANCHSKAVLRIAIDELVRNNKDIYYLPSYEYVTYCSANPWCEDDRHVQRDTVGEIINMFEGLFFKDSG